jgi:hypothetical protein
LGRPADIAALPGEAHVGLGGNETRWHPSITQADPNFLASPDVNTGRLARL